MKVIQGGQNECMRLKSYYRIYLASALEEKCVGAENLGKGICRVFYRDVFLGHFKQKNIRGKQVSIRLSQNLVLCM